MTITIREFVLGFMLLSIVNIGIGIALSHLVGTGRTYINHYHAEEQVYANDAQQNSQGITSDVFELKKKGVKNGR